jgi:hypothetical protein
MLNLFHVFFSKGRLPTHIHFKYGDKELEIVKDFLYLGIKFSRLGSFRDGPFNFQEVGGGGLWLFLKKTYSDSEISVI